MKNYALVALGVAALAACAWATALMLRAQPPAPPPVAATRPPAFAPGFDDIMTMLVQPRHTKLYYAGAARNWELAAAQSRSLRQAFERVVAVVPNYEGNDVSQGIATFFTNKMKSVDTAIAAADDQRFLAAYKDLTTGCNDCHRYMEHPFLAIKVPGEAQGHAYPDQDFNPAP